MSILHKMRQTQTIRRTSRVTKSQYTVFLLFLIPLFLLSCTSFFSSPASRFLRVSGFDEEIIWQPWQIPQSGNASALDFCAGKMQNPRIEFWALRADLRNPRLGVTVYEKTESIYVSSFTEEYNCVAGINTIPFSPSSARQGEERYFAGIVVSSGVLIARPNPFYDALVFYSSGRAAIVRQRDITDFSNIVHAVGGFNIVLESGRLPERLLDQDLPKQDLPRHPRSAAGISADGAFLYLVAVDGRRINSIGVTEAELGLLLRQLGAYDGLNFDGGGSTALALRFPDGRVRTVNTPMHNNIPGMERAIAAPLGLYLR
jgi:hypothetical protein